MEGSLSARWITCLGFTLRCDRVAKVVQSCIANYFQIFSPLVFSYRLFIFTNRGNSQVRTWVWRKFATENRVNFQRGTGVKWSSQSRKTNFLTLPDLGFGFVYKRSGNEIWRNLYLLKMEAKSFRDARQDIVRIQKVIWDHLLAFKGEIIQEQALFSLPFRTSNNSSVVLMSVCSVFSFVLFSTSPRSFFRLNHARKAWN